MRMIIEYKLFILCFLVSNFCLLYDDWKEFFVLNETGFLSVIVGKLYSWELRN